MFFFLSAIPRGVCKGVPSLSDFTRPGGGGLRLTGAEALQLPFVFFQRCPQIGGAGFLFPLHFTSSRYSYLRLEAPQLPATARL